MAADAWLIRSTAFTALAKARCDGCGSVGEVWDTYFAAEGGRYNFKKPGDDILESIRDDDDHLPVEDPILDQIKANIPVLVPRLAGRKEVEVSMDEAGAGDAHEPTLVFNHNTRAGGQLIGSTGGADNEASEFGDDTCHLDGRVHLFKKVSADSRFSVVASVIFHYDITDAVDFCPGNTGETAPAAVVQVGTTMASQLEASGMARDVKVEAHYDRRRSIAPVPTPNPDDLRPKPPTPRHIVVPATTLFDFDKFQLKPEAEKELLKRLGDGPTRADAAKPFLVRGHTDAKGSPSYNMDLSLRRAITVTRLLEEHYPNVRSHVRPVGLGANEPVAPNEIAGRDNPEGRKQNRRVEILFAVRGL
jgi:outer membrane protein OmpA-like peptidoglycan-associated protein